LVVPITVKASPGLSVKSNWNVPLGVFLGLFKLIALDDQRTSPGNIAMDDGELKPDANTEPVPSGVNLSIVPLPEFAT